MLCSVAAIWSLIINPRVRAIQSMVKGSLITKGLQRKIRPLLCGAAQILCMVLVFENLEETAVVVRSG